jgi:hypothetical protein
MLGHTVNHQSNSPTATNPPTHQQQPTWLSGVTPPKAASRAGDAATLLDSTDPIRGKANLWDVRFKCQKDPEPLPQCRTSCCCSSCCTTSCRCQLLAACQLRQQSIHGSIQDLASLKPHRLIQIQSQSDTELSVRHSCRHTPSHTIK